jgi:hydrogenase maturation protease
VSETGNKVLLLGLGNDVLTDDAVGLIVVRHLREEFASHVSVDVEETAEMGLALLDFMVGYREVLIVDSIQTHRTAPGTLTELDPQALHSLTGRTPHFLGVGETLALGRQLGLAMPERVRVLAIEVADALTLATRMTPELEEALPRILAEVKDRLVASAQRVAGGGPG